jgi:hypothetical protein
VRRAQPFTYAGGRHRAHAGRGGAPASEFGWPHGPLAPLFVWQTADGLPLLLEIGEARFVQAASAPDPSVAGLPAGTATAIAASLDDLLCLVPAGCGVQVDLATPAARAVRPAAVADLRLRDAPGLEQDGVRLDAVPEHLAGEVSRLRERLAERGVTHAWVVLARSAPDEHGEVTEGLWVGVSKKSTPLDRLDTVWAAVVEADLWPPVRLVVIEDVRLTRAGAFTVHGTRVGDSSTTPVEVRALSWRESWLVTLAIVAGALPYAISKEANAPGSAGSLFAWTTVVLEGLLLFFVLRWALGRRADGQPASGRVKVPAATWVGVAIFGGAALWGLLRHRV